MINKVTLVGNLGADPQLRRLESGVSVARFSVATTERYKDQEGKWHEQTEWHDVVAWRQLAERAEQKLRKGMQVYLEGKLSTRQWRDKQDIDRKSTEVVLNFLRILNAREDAGEGTSDAVEAPVVPPSINISTPPPAPTKTVTPTNAPAAADNTVDNSNLPF